MLKEEKEKFRLKRCTEIQSFLGLWLMVISVILSKQIDTTNIANVSQIYVCWCNCNVLENDLFILHTYFELKRYEHVKINKRISYSIHTNVYVINYFSDSTGCPTKGR